MCTGADVHGASSNESISNICRIPFFSYTKREFVWLPLERGNKRDKDSWERFTASRGKRFLKVEHDPVSDRCSLGRRPVKKGFLREKIPA